MRDIRAVVIGGGTGAPVSIKTLLSMGIETCAVVAMADDGGSTGELRAISDVTPPGDIRKCLVAFAKNPDDPLTRAFSYRFDFTRNHALGNLMLAALEVTAGSFPEAIQVCESLLQAQGHVYPSTLDGITLSAQTCDGRVLNGQANASSSKTALRHVWIDSDRECTPYQAAIDAILNADLIVLGPGSLFTSIIPNLLVPGIIEAIKESPAKTVFVCSLADMQGETWGLSAYEHVQAILNHGMRGHLDYVLIHSPFPLRAEGAVTESFKKVVIGIDPQDNDQLVAHNPTIRPVSINFADIKRIQDEGPLVIVRDMVDNVRPTWHEPESLRLAFEGVLKLCHLPQM